MIQSTLQVREALSSLIYFKIFRLANDPGSESGTVLSVASSDVGRVAGGLAGLHASVRVTLQLVLAFLSLYQLLGVWMLPGVVLLVSTSPLLGLLARCVTHVSQLRADLTLSPHQCDQSICSQTNGGDGQADPVRRILDLPLTFLKR